MLSSRCFILIQFKWAPSTADEPGAGNIEFPVWFRVLWNCKDACSNIIEKLSFIQDCCPFHFAPEPVTPLHQMMLLSLLNRTLMQPLSLQTPHSWCLVTAVDSDILSNYTLFLFPSFPTRTTLVTPFAIPVVVTLKKICICIYLLNCHICKWK